MEAIIGNPKFETLEKNQLKALYGGKTEGGSEKNGPQRSVRDETNKCTIFWEPMRCWDSDYMKDGMMCYVGLTEYEHSWVVHW